MMGKFTREQIRATESFGLVVEASRARDWQTAEVATYVAADELMGGEGVPQMWSVMEQVQAEALIAAAEPVTYEDEDEEAGDGDVA